jgi:hypothetical protein
MFAKIDNFCSFKLTQGIHTHFLRAYAYVYSLPNAQHLRCQHKKVTWYICKTSVLI